MSICDQRNTAKSTCKSETWLRTDPHLLSKHTCVSPVLSYQREGHKQSLGRAKADTSLWVLSRCSCPEHRKPLPDNEPPCVSTSFPKMHPKKLAAVPLHPDLSPGHVVANASGAGPRGLAGPHIQCLRHAVYTRGPLRVKSYRCDLVSDPRSLCLWKHQDGYALSRIQGKGVARLWAGLRDPWRAEGWGGHNGNQETTPEITYVWMSQSWQNLQSQRGEFLWV